MWSHEFMMNLDFYKISIVNERKLKQSCVSLKDSSSQD